MDCHMSPSKLPGSGAVTMADLKLFSLALWETCELNAVKDEKNSTEDQFLLLLQLHRPVLSLETQTAAVKSQLHTGFKF